MARPGNIQLKIGYNDSELRRLAEQFESQIGTRVDLPEMPPESIPLVTDSTAGLINSDVNSPEWQSVNDEQVRGSHTNDDGEIERRLRELRSVGAMPEVTIGVDPASGASFRSEFLGFPYEPNRNDDIVEPGMMGQHFRSYGERRRQIQRSREERLWQPDMSDVEVQDSPDPLVTRPSALTAEQHEAMMMQLRSAFMGQEKQVDKAPPVRDDKPVEVKQLLKKRQFDIDD